MGFSKYESAILQQLDNFELEEIEQGINELEQKIDRIFFGNVFKEQLLILTTLKRHSEKKKINREVHELKELLFEEWLNITDSQESRGKVFRTWVKYQNQLKGIEFVRDGLKYELKQLQLAEVSE